MHDFVETKYKLTGLNAKNFFGALKTKNIVLTSVEVLSKNVLVVGVQKKNKKAFLKIAKNYNFVVDELDVWGPVKLLRIAKKNMVLLLCAILVFVGCFVQSFFVLKIEIYGLENVQTNTVLSALDSNNFKVGMAKSQIELNKIESVLCTQIPQISHASAVIVGTTLVVNVCEKIVNSDYAFGHAPIVAPCNLIIKNVQLISGTQAKFANQSVLEGEEIILPFVEFESTKMPVPAKAMIEADVQLFLSKRIQKSDFEANRENVLDDCKTLLYNKLSSKNVDFSNLTQNVEIEEDGEFVFAKVCLTGKILF